MQTVRIGVIFECPFEAEKKPIQSDEIRVRAPREYKFRQAEQSWICISWTLAGIYICPKMIYAFLDFSRSQPCPQHLHSFYC